MKLTDPFILASASPRRRELLVHVTEDFQWEEPGVQECVPSGVSPQEAVMALARQKAHAALVRHPEPCYILGADTMVELNGRLLGKPRDAEEAAWMLRSLSGSTHRVHTGMCLLHNGGEKVVCETTQVVFAPLTEEEIAANVATGEPMGKAGGYAIQMSAAAWVTGICGCYSNVVGLPLARLRLLLMEMEKEGCGCCGAM